MSAVRIIRADYGDAAHAEAVVSLLDVYARDPMGGGKPLSAAARANLVPGLAALPQAFSLLAYDGERPVGLANCIGGFASFDGAPSVNIHDIVVLPEQRGKGVARALFAEIETIAKARGACKVTLEVLSGNARAKAVYAGLGYGDYALDPAHGTALFWQKRIAA